MKRLAPISVYTLGLVSGIAFAWAASLPFRSGRARTPDEPATISATLEPAAFNSARGAEPSSSYTRLERSEELRRAFPERFKEIDRELEATYLEKLIEGLAVTAPAEAARLLGQQSSAESSQFALTLASIWSERSPRDALEWFESQRGRIPPDDYQYGQLTILERLAASDSRALAQEYLKVAEDGNHDLLVHPIALGLANLDPREAIDWLAALPPDRVSHRAVTEAYLGVIETYAQANPRGAASIVTSIESEDMLAALVPQVAAALTALSPQEALAWIETIPSGEAREAGLSRIALTLKDEDPALGIDLLIEALDPSAPPARLVVDTFVELFRADPAILAARLGSLPDELLGDLASTLAEDWIRQPQPSRDFAAFVEQLPPGATLDRVSRALIDQLSASDPVAALRWSRNLQGPDERLGAFRQIAAESDFSQLPELANELVSLNLGADEYAPLYDIIERRINDALPPLVFHR